MGVALSRGTHLIVVYLEAAEPKPAAPKLRPRPISYLIMSPESTGVVMGRQIDTVTRLHFRVPYTTVKPQWRKLVGVVAW
jgi:hypothetical protein